VAQANLGIVAVTGRGYYEVVLAVVPMRVCAEGWFFYAGAAPLIYGLLADLFPPDSRVLLSTIVGASTGLGTWVGQALAGSFGLPWRVPFVLVGVPSVLAATLMLWTTSDPHRGATDAALQEAYADNASYEYSERLTWKKFVRLCQVRTNVLMILQVQRPSQAFADRSGLNPSC
jgi:MFS family permease